MLVRVFTPYFDTLESTRNGEENPQSISEYDLTSSKPAPGALTIVEEFYLSRLFLGMLLIKGPVFIGGRQSTKVAFALLAQPTRVLFSAFPRFILEVVEIYRQQFTA